MIPLFEKVKRQIRGNDRMSRLEAFHHFVQENPEHVVEAMEELSQRQLTPAKTSGRRRRSRATEDELAAVPF